VATVLLRSYNTFLRINRTILLGDGYARRVHEHDHKGRKGKYRQDCMIAVANHRPFLFTEASGRGRPLAHSPQPETAAGTTGLGLRSR
jgi:hypothetical protein